MFKRYKILFLSAIFALSYLAAPKIALAINADCFILNPFGTELPCLGPSGTQLSSTQSGTTGVVNTNFPADTTKTNYICDFDVSATATAAAVVTVTVTNLLGGNKIYQLGVPASPAVVNLIKTFSPCIPATGINTNISVSVGAVGAGGIVNANSSGFKN